MTRPPWYSRRYSLILVWLTLRVWITHPLVRTLRAPAVVAVVMVALVPAHLVGVPGA